jgi:hypothetical protein
MSWRTTPRRLRLPAALAFAAFTGCSEYPTGIVISEVSEPMEARGGIPGPPGDGGGEDDGDTDGGESDPTVAATDPDGAPQDVTLDVRVLGTGFVSGSEVDFLLDGKGTKEVQTNSTSFVSDTELVANITITADAQPELYDVRVTTPKGKKGVGIELFEIVGPTTDLASATADAGAGLYQDGLGFYIGEFSANTRAASSDGASYNTRPQCDEGRSMDLRLPEDADGNPVWALVGPYSDCQGDGARSQLHVPALLGADCADEDWCSIGTEGHEAGSTNFGPDLNYFFVVDVDGDGFDSKPGNEAPHNVVWTDGRFQVTRRASDGTPCRWQIEADTAELWDGDVAYDPTGQPLSLRTVVHRVDGACSF